MNKVTKVIGKVVLRGAGVIFFAGALGGVGVTTASAFAMDEAMKKANLEWKAVPKAKDEDVEELDEEIEEEVEEI